MNDLISENLLAKTLIGDKELFHLETPISFQIGEDIIKELRGEYKKDREIGGYINFGVDLESENMSLKTVEVVFVENQSKTPHNSYAIGKPEHKKAEKQAFNRGLLPFRFHTHPTIGNNPVEEITRYIRQLNTSLADKYQSFRNIHKVDDKNLILPEILVVENNFSMGGMFIGFYNGLVTPNNFKEEKNKSSEELAGKLIDAITDFWGSSNTKTKLMLGTGLVGTAALLVKARKHSIWIVLILFLLIAQTPTLIREKNRYFGMSKGDKLIIEIPEISQEGIRKNINSFKEIAEEQEGKRKPLKKTSSKN